MSQPTPERAPAAPETPDATAALPTPDDGTLPGITPDTPVVFPPGADAFDRVRAVLATAPDSGLTVAEIADAAHVARTTVSKNLVRLAALGSARREVGGNIGRSRQPDRWHPTTADRPATVTPDGQEPSPSNAPNGSAEDADNANGLANSPDSPIDTHPQLARDTEADSAPDTGSTVPAPPDTPAPASEADSGPDTPHVGPDTAAPDGATGTPPPGPTGGTTMVRLGAGALRQQVLTHLNLHPGQTFTPGEIGRALGGRSSGAVANACDKLTADGHAELACEKPRRFRATHPAPDSNANHAPSPGQPAS